MRRAWQRESWDRAFSLFSPLARTVSRGGAPAFADLRALSHAPAAAAALGVAAFREPRCAQAARPAPDPLSARCSRRRQRQSLPIEAGAAVRPVRPALPYRADAQ